VSDNKQSCSWRKRLETIRYNWTDYIVPILFIFLFIACIAVWHFLPSGQVTEKPDEKDEFVKNILYLEGQNFANFGLWYKSNIIIQIILIVTALFATVLASLTTSGNAERIKKW
jgi:hypothetical protein